MNLPTTRLSLLSTALLALSACGGGGGPEQDSTAPGATGPTVTVTSPLTGGATDESTVRVQGGTDGGTTAEVRVNGTAATSSDGFATWTARVPLGKGFNELTVEATDTDQTTTSLLLPFAVQRVDPILAFPFAVAADPDRSLLYVADPAREEVLVMDPSNGSRAVLSGPRNGVGPQFVSPYSLELDAGNERLLLFDLELSAIFTIDLATGDRTILVANDQSTTPSLNSVTVMTMNPAADELLCASSASGLFRVVLSTGALETISGPGTQVGPPITSPTGIAYDKASNLAYVAEASTRSVYTVDLASGERKLFSGSGVATGPDILATGDCELVPTFGLVVVDRGGFVVAIDLATGDRATLSAPSEDEEKDDSFATVRAVAALGEDLYLPDANASGVWWVEGATGDRRLLGSTEAGSGPPLAFPTDLTVDGQGTIYAMITGVLGGDILAIDSRLGTRALVSGTDRGTGDPLFGPQSIDVSPLTGELLVADDDSSLVVVDPQSGDRSRMNFIATASATAPRLAVWHPTSPDRSLYLDVVADALASFDRVTGEVELVAEVEEFGRSMELDGDDGRMLIASFDEILAVDLGTGDVTTVAGGGSAAPGLEVERFRHIALDEARDLLYFRDDELDQVGVVDLATGELSLVSGANRGSGPSFSYTGPLGISPDGQTLFVYASHTRSLVAVNVQTGDRLVLSR